jgi:hypothetical protein
MSISIGFPPAKISQHLEITTKYVGAQKIVGK